MHHLTDEEVYQQCIHFGAKARIWRNKFLALLNEVYKRQIYLAKGFDSIYEFGGKIGGVTNDQVDDAIGIKNQIEKKSPLLTELLEEGTVSLHKIARVASIITPENEHDLYNKVQILSKKALDQYVRDVKAETQIRIESNATVNQGCVHHAARKEPLSKLPVIEEFLDVQELGLNFTVVKHLHGLKQKGIDINELLTTLLHQREENIQSRKNKLAQKMDNNAEDKPQTRNIPTEIANILHEEYGTKCAHPNCTRPSEETHHTARFGQTGSHNPLFMAPLCRQHHEIAHAIDIKVVKKKWAHMQ